MTDEDHRLLTLWQKRREQGIPPELRLAETKDEIMSAFDKTIAALRGDRATETEGMVG